MSEMLSKNRSLWLVDAAMVGDSTKDYITAMSQLPAEQIELLVSINHLPNYVGQV